MQPTVAPDVVPTTSPVSADTSAPSAAPMPGPISATWELLTRGARSTPWGWHVATSTDGLTALSGACLSTENGTESGLAAIHNIGGEEAENVAQALGNAEGQLGLSAPLSRNGSAFAASLLSGGYVCIYRAADSSVIDEIATGAGWPPSIVALPKDASTVVVTQSYLDANGNFVAGSARIYHVNNGGSAQVGADVTSNELF